MNKDLLRFLTNLRLRDSKARRSELQIETGRTLDYMLDDLPSNYSSVIPATNYAAILRAQSKEFAIHKLLSDDTARDIYFAETRPELLGQVVAYLLFRGLENALVSSDFSDKTYREFLLNLIKSYFGGSTPANLEASASLFSNAEVSITELFLEARKAGSQFDISDSFGYSFDVNFDTLALSVNQVISLLTPQFFSGVQNPDTLQILNNIAFLLSSLEPAHVLVDNRLLLEEPLVTSTPDCPTCIPFCPCEPEPSEVLNTDFYVACNVYIGQLTDSEIETLEKDYGPTLGSGLELLEGLITDINSRAITIDSSSLSIRITNDTVIWRNTDLGLTEDTLTNLLNEDSLGSQVSISARYYTGDFVSYSDLTTGYISNGIEYPSILAQYAESLNVPENEVQYEQEFLRSPVFFDTAKFKYDGKFLDLSKSLQAVKSTAVFKSSDDLESLKLELQISQRDIHLIKSSFTVSTVFSAEPVEVYRVTNVTKKVDYDLTGLTINGLTVQLDSSNTTNIGIGTEEDDEIEISYYTFVNPSAICDSSSLNVFNYYYDDIRQQCCDTFCVEDEDISNQSWPRSNLFGLPISDSIALDGGVYTPAYFDLVGTLKDYRTKHGPIIIPDSRDRLAFNPAFVTVTVAEGVTEEQATILSAGSLLLSTENPVYKVLRIFNSTKHKVYSLDDITISEDQLALSSNSVNTEIGMDVDDVILIDYRMDPERVNVDFIDPLAGILTLRDEPPSKSEVKATYCYLKRPTFAMILGDPHFRLGDYNTNNQSLNGYNVVLADPGVPGQIVYPLVCGFDAATFLEQKKEMRSDKFTLSKIPLRTINIPNTDSPELASFYYTRVDASHSATIENSDTLDITCLGLETEHFKVERIYNVTQDSSYSLDNLEYYVTDQIHLSLEQNPDNILIGMNPDDEILVFLSYYSLRYRVSSYTTLNDIKRERKLRDLADMDVDHPSPLFSVAAETGSNGYWFVSTITNKQIDTWYFDSEHNATYRQISPDTGSSPTYVRVASLDNERLAIVTSTTQANGDASLYLRVISSTGEVNVSQTLIASGISDLGFKGFDVSVVPTTDSESGVLVISYTTDGLSTVTLYNSISIAKLGDFNIPFSDGVTYPRTAATVNGWILAVDNITTPYTMNTAFFSRSGIVVKMIEGVVSQAYDADVVPLYHPPTTESEFPTRGHCSGSLGEGDPYGYALVYQKHDSFYGENYIYTTHFTSGGVELFSDVKIAGPSRFFQSGPQYFVGQNEFVIARPGEGYVVGFIGLTDDNTFSLAAISNDGSPLHDLVSPIEDLVVNIPPESFVAFPQIISSENYIIATWQTEVFIEPFDGLNSLRFLLNDPPESLLNNFSFSSFTDEENRFICEDIFQSSIRLNSTDTLQKRFTPAVFTWNYSGWQAQHSSVLHSTNFKKNTYRKPSTRASFKGGRNRLNDYAVIESLTPTILFEGTPLIPETLNDKYGKSRKEYLDDTDPLIESKLFTKLYANLKTEYTVDCGDRVDYYEPGKRYLRGGTILSPVTDPETEVFTSTLGCCPGGITLGYKWDLCSKPYLKNFNLSKRIDKVLDDKVKRTNLLAQFSPICDSGLVDIEFSGFEDRYFFSDCDTLVLNTPKSVLNRPCGPNAQREPWVLYAGINPVSISSLEDTLALSKCPIRAVITVGEVSSEYCLFAGKWSKRSEDVDPVRPIAIIQSDSDIIKLGDEITFDGSDSYDPSSLALTYEWEVLRAPDFSTATLDSPTEVITTFTPDRQGNYIIRLQVNNGEQLSVPVYFSVAVHSENLQPVADAGFDAVTVITHPIVLNGTDSFDPEGDDISYLWEFVETPEGSLAVLSNAETATPTFTPDVPGTYVVKLTVSDGILEDIDTVTIVGAVEDPTAVISISASEADIGSAVELDGSGSFDPLQLDITYQWEFTSLPTDSTATIDDPSSAITSFTIDKSGVYEITLTISNGFSENSVSRSVTGKTPHVNHAPVSIAGADQIITVTQSTQLDGSLSYDVDGDTLSYRWSILAGGTGTFSNPNSIRTTFTPTSTGDLILQLTVTDPNNSSSSDTVVVTVVPGPHPNNPPVANAGVDQVTVVGNTVTLDGTKSFDPDGTSLQYLWAIVSKPSGSTSQISSTSASSPRFTPDRVGTYVIGLTVNDGIDSSTQDTVTIASVASNQPPVANAGSDQTVTMGNTVQLNGTGSSDADGDPLTYRWAFSSKPVGSIATLSNTSSPGPTFVADKNGTYIVSLIVNDGQEDSVIDTVTITSNAAPVSNAGVDQTTVLGNVVTLDGSSSFDLDGDTLTYSWSIASKPTGSIASITGATSEIASITPDKVGQYRINLTVNDGTNPSVTSQVVITVISSGWTISNGWDWTL